jgi:hypothetical protein
MKTYGKSAMKKHLADMGCVLLVINSDEEREDGVILNKDGLDIGEFVDLGYKFQVSLGLDL